MLDMSLPLSATQPDLIGLDPQGYIDPELPATAEWGLPDDVEDDLDELDLLEAEMGLDDDDDWIGEDDDDLLGEDDDDLLGEDDDLDWIGEDDDDLLGLDDDDEDEFGRRRGRGRFRRPRRRMRRAERQMERKGQLRPRMQKIMEKRAARLEQRLAEGQVKNPEAAQARLEKMQSMLSTAEAPPEGSGNYGALPLFVQRLAEAGMSPTPINRRRREKVIALLPYMRFRQLRKISRNPFRGRKMRAAAMREIARRQAGGARLIFTEIPFQDQVVIMPGTPAYRARQIYYEQAIPAPVPTRTVIPGAPGIRFRPGTIVREPPASAVVKRPVLAPGRVVTRWTGPKGGTHKQVVTPGGRIRQVHIGPRGRKTVTKIRGEYGAVAVPDGYEIKPKLGSAMWAHPFQTALAIGGAYAVGAAVGSDRTLAVFTGIGDAIRGLFQGR
jgi:hypothetical protein